MQIYARPTLPFAPEQHKSPPPCLFALFILFLAIRLCVYLSRRARPDFTRLQIWASGGVQIYSAVAEGGGERERRRPRVIGGAE